MKPIIQHPFLLGLFPFGLVLAMASILLSPAASQPASKLPVVEPVIHKGYVENINDKVSFEMVPIPGGTYLMGSREGEKGRFDNEGPVHPVTVKPFWMGKLEVTWDEYDIYWENRPKGPPPRPDVTKKPENPDAITSPTPPYEDRTFGYGTQGFPCIAVTHHAAMEYCSWLSKKTGKLYRLPTEAEWEWACRAGTTTAYDFGDDPEKLDEYAWYEKNSNDTPHQVGKKKPNAWGLYDMYGNAAEWCVDAYKKDFYAALPRDKALLLPVNLPTERRYSDVVRGGSWADAAEKCRSAVRRGSDKSWLKRDPQRPQSIWWMTDADWVGLRVVRAVEEDPRLKGIRSKVTWLSD